MDWTKILSAIFLISMLAYLIPRIKPMIQNSPKGSTNDWLLFVALMSGVALFVMFLMEMV